MDPGCLSCIGMLFGSLRTGDIRKFCKATGRESNPRTTAVFNIARGRFSNTEAALATSDGSNLRKRFVFKAITPASAVGTTIIIDLSLTDDCWLASNLIWMPTKGHPMVLMGEVPQAELLALARDANKRKSTIGRLSISKRPLIAGVAIAAVCLSFYLLMNYFGQRVPSSDAEARASEEPITAKVKTKSEAKGRTGAKAKQGQDEPAPSKTKNMGNADATLKDDNAKAPAEDDPSGEKSEPVSDKAEKTNSSGVTAKEQGAQNTQTAESSQQLKTAQPPAVKAKAPVAASQRSKVSQTSVAVVTTAPTASTKRTIDVKAPVVSTKQTNENAVKPQGQSVKALPSSAPVAKPVTRPVAKQTVTSVKQSEIDAQKVQGKPSETSQTAKTADKSSLKVEGQTSQPTPPPAPSLPLPKVVRLQQETRQEESTTSEFHLPQPPVPMVRTGQ